MLLSLAVVLIRHLLRLLLTYYGPHTVSHMHTVSSTGVYALPCGQDSTRSGNLCSETHPMAPAGIVEGEERGRGRGERAARTQMQRCRISQMSEGLSQGQALGGGGGIDVRSGFVLRPAL
jgi:hypothetical protein